MAEKYLISITLHCTHSNLQQGTPLWSSQKSLKVLKFSWSINWLILSAVSVKSHTANVCCGRIVQIWILWILWNPKPKFDCMITSSIATTVPILVEIGQKGSAPKIAEILRVCAFSSFFSCRLDQKRVDGFSRSRPTPQTTWTHTRMCLLGVSMTKIIVRGIKDPNLLQKMDDVIDNFKSKVTKIKIAIFSKLHIG